MTKQIIEIADRFIADEACSRQDLVELRMWLSNPASSVEVEAWLWEHWAMSPEDDSNAMIEVVFRQIDEYHNISSRPAFSLSQIMKVYQRIAAFLLIPLIALGFLFWMTQGNGSRQMVENIVPRGQKSQIILPDGTRIWINSDTKVKYPGNFEKKQRDIYLEGEAFFDVAKETGRPFVVHTSGINVKVLGTKFNVKAYPNENQIETSLFEGKINLTADDSKSSDRILKEVNPGEAFVYSKESHKLASKSFQKEEIDGWKNNRLIFKDDTFNNLVRKVERWYDVKILYDEKLFDDRHLTVELYEGERLERLLEIVGMTLSVNYQYDKGKIILTPKSKDM
jgi:ferric-dicitrate binding protein FerR (iron transport regulator)